MTLTTAGDVVGGLIGLNTGQHVGVISQSYWDVTTSGQSASAGGTGLTTAQMSHQTSYGGSWDFAATWYLIPGLTHPILRSELYGTVINTVDQLELIGQNATTLAGHYTLGQSLDLGPILANPANHWATSGSSGFIPLGNAATPFTGRFDGEGNSIANLTISDMNDHLIGLFGLSSGTIQNLDLTNATIGAGTNFNLASDGLPILGIGALAGENDGTISNVSIGGAVGDPYYTDFPAGGVVGINTGTLTAVFSSVAVFSDTQLGGVAGINSGTIGQSSATGAVTIGYNPDGADAGGLVGINSGSISQSYALGQVSSFGIDVFVEADTEATGGLVGKNTGWIDGSYAGGAVFGGLGSSEVTSTGGLVGINGGTITASYATGAVTSDGSFFAPRDVNTGGLVGFNTGTISRSYATGTVQFGDGSLNDAGDALDSTGGLVGDNSGAIVSSYATGSVITDQSESFNVGSQQYAGGLVGSNESTGTIDGSYATGAVGAPAGIIVPGTVGIGGLVGINGGTITLSYATGTVTGVETSAFATGFEPLGGESDTGGLVGENYATITKSYATGAVFGGGAISLDPPNSFGRNGETTAGGLAGLNVGTISASYATGTVSQADVSSPAITLATGGLVGDNMGTIRQSYAAGTVLGGQSGLLCDVNCAAGLSATGGLAGLSSGTIQDSYAIGSVTDGGATGAGSVSATGGLVGQLSFGTVTRSYSAGTVTLTTSGDAVGGLIGLDTGPVLGVITQSYWDVTTSGQTTSAGGTGLTTAQMSQQSSYDPNWDFTATWYLIPGLAHPILRSELYGTVINTADQLELIGQNAATLAGHYTLGGNLDLGAALGDPSGHWLTAANAAIDAGAYGFIPLGAAGTPFTGSFDGQAHTIDGLTIVQPTGGSVGLFGANSGSIQDIGLTNILVDGAGNVGGLIGADDLGTISDSYTTGTVIASGNNANVGGLIGFTTLSTVARSYSSSAVTATGNGNNVGGLIGRHYASSLDQSYATGTVTSSGSGNRVGGLVGYAWVGGRITNSDATGAVTANGDHTAVGGLVGYLFDSTVATSYATGFVSGTGLKQGVYYGYGGLVGVDIFGTVTQSYWDVDTSGQGTSAAGTGLTTAQLQSGLPPGFSSGIWGLPSAGGYPILLWQLPG